MRGPCRAASSSAAIERLLRPLPPSRNRRARLQASAHPAATRARRARSAKGEVAGVDAANGSNCAALLCQRPARRARPRAVSIAPASAHLERRVQTSLSPTQRMSSLTYRYRRDPEGVVDGDHQPEPHRQDGQEVRGGARGYLRDRRWPDPGRGRQREGRRPHRGGVSRGVLPQHVVKPPSRSRACARRSPTTTSRPTSRSVSARAGPPRRQGGRDLRVALRHSTTATLACACSSSGVPRERRAAHRGSSPPSGPADRGVIGADVSTIPFKVIAQLAKHPLTDAGIERFMADWAKVPQP